VVVLPQGWAFDAPAGIAMLVSARHAGIELPSSCRNGTCRACLCQLAQGRVRYLIDWPGLSAEERRAGSMLPCVAIPDSARIVITAPRAMASSGPVGP
jgi:ferredoxin